ncbi:S-adenosylmethionine:tRNA ribosyltransferase-isomerase, partial [Haliangium sp. UPWRP_2]|uniref:S-adenosylmethionine:tRNA ribosyltransferase-isomerase n=1 Tax=Haliangium sp. UPWRP_2 TaxID=1931276 RepID=UPI001E56DA1B
MPQRSEDALVAYDYVLPPELIATQPAPARDGSRLMVVEQYDLPSAGEQATDPRHQCFAVLPELISR